MTEPLTTRRLVALRKVTRVVADALRATLIEHLGTLAPLLHPDAVLGEFLETDPQAGRGARDGEKGVQVRLLRLNPAPAGGSPHAAAKAAFLPAMAGGRSKQVNREIQDQYASIAGSKLYGLSPQLEPPIQITGSSIELLPFEYDHVIKAPRGTKTVTVTSPLKWVVYYAGFPPARLRELLSDRNRSSHALQSFVLHSLIMRAATSPSTGIGEFLEALRFPAAAFDVPELGNLPLTVISTAVSTFRPPDSLILESTEISGRNAFEEVIQADDLLSVHDSLKHELLWLVEDTAPELLERAEEAKPEPPASPPPAEARKTAAKPRPKR